MKSVIKLRILLLFTVFTLSLFSCGLPTFIMQAVAFFNMSPASAGALESYQNLTLVIITFIAFSYILKVGYRMTLITILGMMIFLSIITPFIATYWMIKVYLVGVGITLVGMKVCIYAAVALVVEREDQHASFLSIIEATWMLAYMAGMWIMSYFIKIMDTNWLYSLFVFTVFGIVTIIIWILTPLDESQIEKEKNQPFWDEVKDIFAICKNKIVIAAILIYFVEQFVECGIMAWMAGFYEMSVHAPKSLSVQVASLTFFAIFVGRIFVVLLLKFIKWEKVLFVYYILGFVLLILTLYTVKAPDTAIKTVWDIPVAGLILPIIGFFLAPSVPVINSSILNRTVKEKQALLMTVMTIVFAVSSSIGARAFGELMQHLGAVRGFSYATIIPFAILIIAVLPYAKYLSKRSVE